MLGRLSRALIGAFLMTGAVVPLEPTPAAADATMLRTPPAAFTAVQPCRLFDTRDPGSPDRLGARDTIDVVIHERCGVPSDAVVAAVTVTAVEPSSLGFLSVFARGESVPETSAVNYRAGDVVANQQFVPIGDKGAVTVFSLAPTDVIVDVTGYFTPAPSGGVRAGRFVPMAQQRLLDTRDSRRPAAGSVLNIDPGLGDDVSAVVVNITTTATTSPGFFTAYAAGTTRPAASVLNADEVDQTRATGTVVGVSRRGFDLFTSASNHVIVDLVGYITGSSADRSSVGLYVGMTPERLADTRRSVGGNGGPRLWDRGTREFATAGLVGSGASAIAATLTVTETEDAGFAVAYPAGTPVPPTSTVNYGLAQSTIANATILRVSDRGIAVGAIESTHVTIDVSGWFTGEPAEATRPPRPNQPPPDRVVTIVSDSAMAGVRWNGALGGLQGFHPVHRLESCRRLVAYSCRGREGYSPRSVVAEIGVLPTPGPEEIIVIATGYNDWHGRFESDFEIVVEAARDKGFHHIAWVDYRSDVGYKLPGTGGARSNYGEMNRILGEQLATGDYPDVRRWRLDDYTAGSVGWFFPDGVHERRLGSWAVADWVSRHVRAFDDRPCVREWSPGGPVEWPCPNPDTVRAQRGLPDIAALYGL